MARKTKLIEEDKYDGVEHVEATIDMKAAISAVATGGNVPKYYNVTLKDDLYKQGNHTVYLKGKMFEFKDGVALVSGDSVDMLKEIGLI